MIAIMARISLDEREVWTSIIDGWGAVLMRPIPREIYWEIAGSGPDGKEYLQSVRNGNGSSYTPRAAWTYCHPSILRLRQIKFRCLMGQSVPTRLGSRGRGTDCRARGVGFDCRGEIISVGGAGAPVRARAGNAVLNAVGLSQHYSDPPVGDAQRVGADLCMAVAIPWPTEEPPVNACFISRLLLPLSGFDSLSSLAAQRFVGAAHPPAGNCSAIPSPDLNSAL